MCGIFGIIAKSGGVAPEVLERATNSLAHRGPDDAGTVILHDDKPEPLEIGLGHRRLAVIDLSPLGHQPMQDEATGNWIVFNGEIYNFRNIREKLEGENVSFRSQSDTEVLLKAYGHWGERCLDKLRGIFAFAVWDARRHRLFVARDHMGVKPLYYHASEKQFVFASEVHALLESGLVPRRLNRAAVLNYLTFGSACDPTTLIESVSALLPGHFLIWQNGQLQIKKYWDLGSGPDTALQVSAKPLSERKIIEENLYTSINEAVRMQMVSDVPVGVFLSGGIDSSALVGILNRGGSKVSTFSIIFQEAEFNEAEYSRQVAAEFDTDHHEILVSQHDLLHLIPQALRAMDQPTIDGLNTYLISQKTRETGIKVVLSGLGGDELFAGYSNFHTVPRMERLAKFWGHLPKAARVSIAHALQFLSPANDQTRKFITLAQANGQLVHPYFLARMLFTPQQRDEVIPGMDSSMRVQAQFWQREVIANTVNMDTINRVSYLESRCYMLNTLLRDSDAMSMAHGLELRVPLLDHHLAAKLFAMPGEWKVGLHKPKPLLVNALYGALPENIVHRPKKGFTFPLEHWLRDELRPDVEKTLRRIPDGPLGPVLNAEATWKVWTDFERGMTSWSRPWALYVLQNWCELNSIV